MAVRWAAEIVVVESMQAGDNHGGSPRRHSRSSASNGLGTWGAAEAAIMDVVTVQTMIDEGGGSASTTNVGSGPG